MTLSIMTQHNDTQHNDTQHNDTQHNDTRHNDTQHNDTQHNNNKYDTRHDSKDICHLCSISQLSPLFECCLLRQVPLCRMLFC